MSEKTVFISYRRDTAGKYFARSVEGALTHRGYDVFLDVDCIDAGEWAKQILTPVPKRAHFLLLLTPGALERCADENDWVRRESCWRGSVAGTSFRCERSPWTRPAFVSFAVNSPRDITASGYANQKVAAWHR